LAAPTSLSAQDPTFTESIADHPARLTLERYLDLESVSNPVISPDGRRVVYNRTFIDKMTDSRKTALWIVNADGTQNRTLTQGRDAVWSPSGDRIAFTGCGTMDAQPTALADCPDGAHRQIWVRIMEGDGQGTNIQVTRTDEDASNPAWSPDGTTIAFSMFEPSDGPDWQVDLPGKPEGAEWTDDPTIVDQAWYRRDRRGFFRPGHTHLWVVPADGGTPRKLTPDLYDKEDLYGGGEEAQWSPDGEWIYFDGLADPRADLMWTTNGYGRMETEIWRVRVASGTAEQITDHAGADRSPVVSPDGRHVAWISIDATERQWAVDDVVVAQADGSSPRNLTADSELEPNAIQWAPDGSGLYMESEWHGDRDLWFVPLDGSGPERVSGETGYVLEDVHVGRDGSAVGVYSDAGRPGDVIAFTEADPLGRFLTDVNADLLAGVDLGEQEEIWFEAPDGMRVQGWIIKPPDFDPARTYPLMLQIHGGPHSMYDVGFSYSYQNYAANGYVVLRTNPRGSTGYGEAFGNAIERDYPGPDLQDLMAGVDAVTRQGYIDEDNLFVTGCSGGGILTEWVITHTDRFQAAVARCPISNWLTFVGTVDGPYWYNWFEHMPWEDPSEHLRRSPLMYVENVTTPTLLMTGELDLRTPIPQTEEFYQALVMEGVPTKMIRMKEEWHGTSSRPSNFMRTQLFTMRWFEQYAHGGRGVVE
jgi:dipeptidyl aminopeptidase/acylaminoacyl peptidase